MPTMTGAQPPVTALVADRPRKGSEVGAPPEAGRQMSSLGIVPVGERASVALPFLGQLPERGNRPGNVQ
jgi:hypothetical protein